MPAPRPRLPLQRARYKRIVTWSVEFVPRLLGVPDQDELDVLFHLSEPSLTSLNWDVLLHIISFLPRCDISSLMRTSQDLYELCLRQLFRGPIELRADHLRSLYACLRLGTPPSRPSFIRTIIVKCSLSSIPRFSEDKTASVSIDHFLRDIFQAARGLKQLQLDWGAASSSSYLRHAAPALTNLEELHAPFVSQALWENITTLRAPIRKLTATFGPMNRLPAANPVSLLDPFRATLEELDLSVVQCEDDGMRYAHVRKLALSDCYYGLSRGGINLGPVIRAFPSVEEFAFSASKVLPEVSHWRDGRSCDRVDVIERCRSVNQQWQRTNGPWTSLTRVRVGHVVDLYMLGLCRSVYHVEVQSLSAGTIWMLPYVLADTHPSSLAILLFARSHILDRLPSLVSSCECTSSLVEFTLSLQCDHSELDADEIVTNLTGLLKLLSVHRLSLCLLRWDTIGPYRMSHDELAAIDSALDRIHSHADSIASRILCGIPSVQELTIIIGRREDRWKRNMIS